MKTFLLSFPRCGNAWLRYCIEAISGAPSGESDKSQGINRAFGCFVDHIKTDWSIDIIRKVHRMPNYKRGRQWESNRDRVILLVRNYKECIVRHLGTTNVNKLISNTTGDCEKDVDYMSNILMYDSWPESMKTLVYYEDFIVSPKLVLKQVFSFLKIDVTEDKMNSFFDNYQFHKDKCLEIYSPGHKSYTRGDKDKLIFHSNQLSLQERIKWDSVLKKRFGKEIFNQYLSRYAEK